MSNMGVVALGAWLLTGGCGLYLLAIWLIEYDREFQTTTRTRLPVPVLSTHVVLAMAGLAAWSAYLFLDKRVLAIMSVILLLCVVVLGFTMAYRWLTVLRDDDPGVADAGGASVGRIAAAGVAIADVPGTGSGRPATAGASLRSEHRPAHRTTVPPERNFPPSVVIAHGIFAMSTLILVGLTALGVAIH
jgi:hypothetical protein